MSNNNHEAMRANESQELVKLKHDESGQSQISFCRSKNKFLFSKWIIEGSANLNHAGTTWETAEG